MILADDAPNHIVGLPFTLKFTSNLRASSKEFWDYFTLRKGNDFHEFVSSNRLYIDTKLSRFYIIYNDKSQCAAQISLLKKIWDKREVVIIEGAQSRTGVGNVNSIQRIIGYSTNAFSHYDKMLEAVASNVTPDKLILLSYGPTATILAYDLAKLGYQAIDIGHLDIEYEWFEQGAIDNVAIKGKFTNEAVGGRVVDTCMDKIYNDQIICDVTLN